METKKADNSRFASNDSSNLSVANRRSSGFLQDRQIWPLPSLIEKRPGMGGLAPKGRAG